MKTKDEIVRQINGLQNQRKNSPKINLFGTDNWQPIDAKISVLQGASLDGYANATYEVKMAAHQAHTWLETDMENDLFES
jgi:hypothetical protein